MNTPETDPDLDPDACDRGCPEPEPTHRERYDAREALLEAAHACVGDRVNERAEDPGWTSELHDEHLLIAAREFVRLHEGVEVVGG